MINLKQTNLLKRNYFVLISILIFGKLVHGDKLISSSAKVDQDYTRLSVAQIKAITKNSFNENQFVESLQDSVLLNRGKKNLSVEMGEWPLECKNKVQIKLEPIENENSTHDIIDILENGNSGMEDQSQTESETNSKYKTISAEKIQNVSVIVHNECLKLLPKINESTPFIKPEVNFYKTTKIDKTIQDKKMVMMYQPMSLDLDYQPVENVLSSAPVKNTVTSHQQIETNRLPQSIDFRSKKKETINSLSIGLVSPTNPGGEDALSLKTGDQKKNDKFNVLDNIVPEMNLNIEFGQQ